MWLVMETYHSLQESLWVRTAKGTEGSTDLIHK